MKVKNNRAPKKNPRKKESGDYGSNLVFTLLLLSMSGYIIYYSATHKQELINNSYNGRQQMLLAQNRRGSIYSGDGQILARTVEGEDGKEVREYPYGNLFSHVVGYAVNGKMGLESQCNYYLINSNAPLSQKASLEAKGENIRVIMSIRHWIRTCSRLLPRHLAFTGEPFW